MINHTAILDPDRYSVDILCIVIERESLERTGKELLLLRLEVSHEQLVFLKALVAVVEAA